MSARRSQWDELSPAQQSAHRWADVASRPDPGSFSLPILTWEEIRAGWMSGLGAGWLPEGWVGVDPGRHERSALFADAPPPPRGEPDCSCLDRVYPTGTCDDPTNIAVAGAWYPSGGVCRREITCYDAVSTCSTDYPMAGSWGDRDGCQEACGDDYYGGALAEGGSFWVPSGGAGECWATSLCTCVDGTTRTISSYYSNAGVLPGYVTIEETRAPRECREPHAPPCPPFTPLDCGAAPATTDLGVEPPSGMLGSATLTVPADLCGETRGEEALNLALQILYANADALDWAMCKFAGKLGVPGNADVMISSARVILTSNSGTWPIVAEQSSRQGGCPTAITATPTADAWTGEDGTTTVFYYDNYDYEFDHNRSALASAIQSYDGLVDYNACALAAVLAHELMHVVGWSWTDDRRGQRIPCLNFTNSVSSEFLYYLNRRYGVVAPADAPDRWDLPTP